MGMSIKETIPILHDMYNYYNDTDIDAYVGFDKEDNNAIETALDTIYKYQKIEQILDDWKNDGGAFEMSESYWLKLISEVIKDGNEH